MSVHLLNLKGFGFDITVSGPQVRFQAVALPREDVEMQSPCTFGPAVSLVRQCSGMHRADETESVLWTLLVRPSAQEENLLRWSLLSKC